MPKGRYIQRAGFDLHLIPSLRMSGKNNIPQSLQSRAAFLFGAYAATALWLRHKHPGLLQSYLLIIRMESPQNSKTLQAVRREADSDFSPPAISSISAPSPQ